MAPLSTQTQHENEKYKNAAKRVGECPLLRKLRKKLGDADMLEILLEYERQIHTLDSCHQLGA
jgi:hypothetical protein